MWVSFFSLFNHLLHESRYKSINHHEISLVQRWENNWIYAIYILNVPNRIEQQSKNCCFLNMKNKVFSLFKCSSVIIIYLWSINLISMPVLKKTTQLQLIISLAFLCWFNVFIRKIKFQFIIYNISNSKTNNNPSLIPWFCLVLTNYVRPIFISFKFQIRLKPCIYNYT